MTPSTSKDRKLFNFRTREQAARLQTQLSESVVEETPLGFKPRRLCGVDVAYQGDQGFASAVLWDTQSASVVARSTLIRRVRVDYLPGFLGFREGLLTLAAARKLSEPADAFMLDGHGRVHPRKFGLACHVGLALAKPTIGVAKSLFYGVVENERIVGPEGDLLGRVVRTKSGRNFYVSVGNRISLDDAARLVERSIANDHPAPLREAHLEAIRLRRVR